MSCWRRKFISLLVIGGSALFAAVQSQQFGDDEDLDTPAPTGYSILRDVHLEILKSYNRHLRPLVSGDSPLHCNFSIIITHIQHVDEDYQTVTIHGWMVLQWYDDRLVWRGKQPSFVNVSKLLLPQQYIWHPDLHVYNNADTRVDAVISSSTLAQLFDDGRVVVDPPYSFNVYCNFDYRNYPWDRQHCTATLGSWAYRINELQWILPEVDAVQFNNSHRTYDMNWRVERADVTLEELKYLNESWHYIKINMELTRGWKFAYRLIVGPTLVAATLVVAGFLLAAGEPNRKLTLVGFALGIGLLHFLALYLILPRGALNSARLIGLCKGSLLVSVSSLVLAALVSLLSDRTDEPPPKCSSFLQSLAVQVLSWPERRLVARDSTRRRRGANNRHAVVITNQIGSPKQRQSMPFVDDVDPIDGSIEPSSSTPLRHKPDRQCHCCDVATAAAATTTTTTSRGQNPLWWRFSVVIDRLIGVILIAIYAIMFHGYL